MTLKFKLYILLPCIISLGLVILGFIIYFESRIMLEENYLERTNIVLRSDTELVNEYFSAKTELLVSLTNNDLILSNNADTIMKILESSASSSKTIDGIFLGLKDGKLFYSGSDSEKEQLEKNFIDEAWYKKAIKTPEELVFSNIHLDNQSQKPALVISKGIESRAGNVFGVIGIKIFLSDLIKKIQTKSVLKNGIAKLIAFNNKNDSEENSFEVVQAIKYDNQIQKFYIEDYSQKSYLKDQDLLSRNRENLKYEDNENKSMIFLKKTQFDNWYFCIEIAKAGFLSDIEKLSILIIILIVVSIILLTLPIIIITKQILQSIREVKGFSKRIARFDFTIREEKEKKGELGQIVNSITIMGKNLNELLTNVSNTSTKVADSADLLKISVDNSFTIINSIMKSINDVGKEVMNQSSAVENTGVVVEEMINSIDLVANDVETQASAVSQTSSSIQEMVSSINSVVEISQRANNITKSLEDVANDGSKMVEKAIASIKDIEASTGQINEIIAVMSGISEQTNMLAMNAAIEAAHAGQSGKGFAVVADEIRKLAESSSSSAKEISDLIKAINGKISNAVELAEKSGIGLNKILEDVNQTATINSEIYSAMDEQSIGANEILKSIASLLDITERVKNMTREQKQGTTKISNSIVELNQITEKIVKSIDEENQNSFEMEDSIKEISQITENNFSIVEDLKTLISNFKTRENEKTKNSKANITLKKESN